MGLADIARSARNVGQKAKRGVKSDGAADIASYFVEGAPTDYGISNEANYREERVPYEMLLPNEETTPISYDILANSGHVPELLMDSYGLAKMSPRMITRFMEKYSMDMVKTSSIQKGIGDAIKSFGSKLNRGIGAVKDEVFDPEISDYSKILLGGGAAMTGLGAYSNKVLQDLVESGDVVGELKDYVEKNPLSSRIAVDDIGSAGGGTVGGTGGLVAMNKLLGRSMRAKNPRDAILSGVAAVLAPAVGVQAGSAVGRGAAKAITGYKE